MGVVLIFLVSLILLVVGLVKPSLVIRWGERKTRPMVLMIYGGISLVSFIVFGVISVSTDPAPTVATAKVEQKATTDEAKAVADKKLTYEDAYMRLADWLNEHMFDDATSFKLSKAPADGSMYKLEGKEYHLITMTGLPRLVDVLVDPNTGEMFFHDIGVTKPLNDWYFEYRRTHTGTQQSQGGKIDKNFEWVQMPTQKGDAIVGKVKNTSGKTLPLVKINFTLYDSEGNQLGNAYDTISNLQAGNTWSFTADVLTRNVAKYEFAGIQHN